MGEQTIRFFVKHPIRERLVNSFCKHTTENPPVLWYEFTVVERRLERRTADGELVQL